MKNSASGLEIQSAHIWKHLSEWLINAPHVSSPEVESYGVNITMKCEGGLVRNNNNGHHLFKTPLG